MILSQPAHAAASGDLSVNPWSAWLFTPAIAGGALIALAVYFKGVRRRRAGSAAAAGIGRHLAYVGGVLCTVLALQSPLDALADHFFTAHQLEHLLLRMATPMLLALSAPLPLLLRGLPGWTRRALVRPAAGNRVLRGVYAVWMYPPIATAIYVGLLYLWEWPPLHDAALRDEELHDFMHATMLISGLFFWWLVLDPRPRHARLRLGGKLILLWAAMVPNSVLGLYLTLATHSFYPAYDHRFGAWRMAALTDQQWGALIMWIPGDMMMAVGFFIVFSRWLRQQAQERAASAPPGTVNPVP